MKERLITTALLTTVITGLVLAGCWSMLMQSAERSKRKAINEQAIASIYMHMRTLEQITKSIRSETTLPMTCTVGEVYFETSTNRLYTCQAVPTWHLSGRR